MKPVSHGKGGNTEEMLQHLKRRQAAPGQLWRSFLVNILAVSGHLAFPCGKTSFQRAICT